MQPKLSKTKMPSSAIIVMGVSGCGKSTLAQLLATTLACPFIEADSLHSENNIAKMRAGQALNDDDRWPWLDRVGAQLQQATTQHSYAVAACSALKLSYRDRLRSAITSPTVFILLDTDHTELTRRLEQRAGHYMPASLLTSQLSTLEKPLAAEGALMLDSRLSPQHLCEASLAWLTAATHTVSDA